MNLSVCKFVCFSFSINLSVPNLFKWMQSTYFLKWILLNWMSLSVRLFVCVFVYLFVCSSVRLNWMCWKNYKMQCNSLKPTLFKLLFNANNFCLENIDAHPGGGWGEGWVVIVGNKKGYKCQNREPPTQFFQRALNPPSPLPLAKIWATPSPGFSTLSFWQLGMKPFIYSFFSVFMQ